MISIWFVYFIYVLIYQVSADFLLCVTLSKLFGVFFDIYILDENCILFLSIV